MLSEQPRDTEVNGKGMRLTLGLPGHGRTPREAAVQERGERLRAGGELAVGTLEHD